MTDANSIFEPTQPPLAPPVPEGNSRKKLARKAPGKRRGPRKTPAAPQATAAPAAEPAKKRARKPRTASPAAGGRKPRQAKGVKLDLTTMMGALVGLKAQDANLVGKIVQAMQTVNKKSRQRVLDAVGRIFA